MQTLSIVLNCASAIFAFVAAALWLMSARVSLPRTFSVHVVKSSTSGTLGVLGGQYMGNAYSEDFVKLGDGLHRQNRLSAWAARGAAVAAILQGLGTLTQIAAG